jgi:hypothetical protein
MLLPMSDLSYLYRSRAVACEQRCREISDPALKREWQDLAIQWHLMSNVAAQADGQISQIEMA